MSFLDELLYGEFREWSSRGIFMRFKMSLLITAMFFLPCVRAAINCEPTNNSGWNAINTPFELNVTQVDGKKANVTLGSNLNNFTLLYTMKAIDLGIVGADCSSSTYLYYTMFSSDYGASVGNVGGEIIYPTSVTGLGISVTSTSGSVALYPSVVYYGTGNNGYGFWVNVKLWKIPGDLPLTTGLVSFSGPTVGQILMRPGYTFTSSALGRLYDNNKAFIASSRILKGTLIFQPTTCDLVMTNRTVYMGEYDGSGGKSAWKDASFNLKCPNAYGYDGVTTVNNYAPNSEDEYRSTYMTPNSKQNNPIRIQIVPRTAVVDANSGIIGLDGSGAQGYGIQLAWGDSGSLGSGTPAKPVILNSWTLANSLNSAYSASAYAIGATAISTGADGTIKMAARYVRTSGTVQPGPANAAVEVIATYQ